MKKIYYPKGVCSQRFDIEIENGIVKDIVIYGGCDGNLKGISALLRGRSAEESAEILSGIRCGMKSTSCPDQISKALKEAISEEKAAE